MYESNNLFFEIGNVIFNKIYGHMSVIGASYKDDERYHNYILRCLKTGKHYCYIPYANKVYKAKTVSNSLNFKFHGGVA